MTGIIVRPRHGAAAIAASNPAEPSLEDIRRAGGGERKTRDVASGGAFSNRPAGGYSSPVLFQCRFRCSLLRERKTTARLAAHRPGMATRKNNVPASIVSSSSASGRVQIPPKEKRCGRAQLRGGASRRGRRPTRAGTNRSRPAGQEGCRGYDLQHRRIGVRALAAVSFDW